MAQAPASGVVYRNVGEKYYELKDHLGNVRVVVNDRKDLNATNNTLSAHVVSYSNYYPFGMPQPNRNFDSQEYRYGFNGKEKDDEIKGAGNSYDYGARMYDPRVGNWLSVDPLAEKGPQYSPYLYVFNNPIKFVDPDGRLDGEYDVVKNDDGTTTTTKISNLGDKDGIDFFHQMNGDRQGDTEIVNNNTGETNWVNDGMKYIRGYTQRDDNTNWNSVYQEWQNGTGSENSLFYDRDNPMIKDIRTSNLYHGARNDYLKAKAWDFDNKISKKYISMSFGLSGLLLSGTNMTMQMMGSGGVSFYDIGNNHRLIIITDQKTKESFYYHLPWINNISRTGLGTQPRQSTTNQTYIWIDNNVEQ